MNKLEFKEVINYYGYDEKDITKNHYGYDTDIYKIGPITLYFSDTYYTIVKGKVPYEKAIDLFNNYDNRKFHIRVDGGGDDWSPTNRLVDDTYIKAVDDLKYVFSIDQLDKLNEELKARNNKDKYVDCYHIDTLEGLIIFLNIVLDKKLDYQDVYREITKRIIKKNIDINKKINLDKRIIASMNYGNSIIKNDCRRLINDFDNLIFPYNNIVNSIAYASYSGYLDYETLLDIYKIRIEKKNEYETSLIDDDVNITYGYSDNTFSYRISYKVDEDISYFFSHYIYDNKECFVVCYSAKDDYMHLTYNLTDDKVSRKSYANEEDTNNNDYKLLKNELINALYILNNLVFNKEEVKTKKL